MTEFQPAASYLPHETPMVFVEKVSAIDSQGAVCEVNVDCNGILAPFLTPQGELPAWFAIEIMAQTIGVWRGWHGMQLGQEPRLGMLLGGRGFKSTLAAYPSGSRLLVSVTMLLQDDKLASFDCRLTLDGKEVTQTKLNVYQPDDAELRLLIQPPNGKDTTP
ncbi:dehydratase [Leminorella grimontii]|uniref:Dehydratase n=1 Tax=Leminorella grimontii TaxID=82981 RepID=A0AAV5N675_9GAMM|nr:hotdog family protein [Leminorella grimontii]KFC93413.1 3-hydroxydecanoyl-[ACP] dehydratase [Leminorella grimontii ATCC 33999 = DSM 5078]GKX55892.1 dehydratase [Leminorella grimontii]VFS54949.1 (3R)-hydroxymyristoyl-ACP dehydratase [Leminorella grimontii]